MKPQTSIKSLMGHTKKGESAMTKAELIDQMAKDAGISKAAKKKKAKAKPARKAAAKKAPAKNWTVVSSPHSTKFSSLSP